MKYCIKCLQPDTRPNTYFTEEGLCPACNYHNKLKDVDWNERFEQLKTILTNKIKCSYYFIKLRNQIIGMYSAY